MKKIKFITLLLSHFLARYFRKGRSVNNQNLPLRGGYKRSHFLIKYKYFVLLVLVLSGVFLFWRAKTAFPNKTVVSEGIVGAYTSNNLPPIVAGLISRPLVSLDKSGYPKPDLVSGWQVNNDATLYTFKLKDNLFWSDGTVVKASDIRFRLPDVEVLYPDDKTIEFKLADSFNPFPSLLTAPVFKQDGLIGIGKFRVVGETFNHNLIAKLLLVSPTDILPALTVRFYPDERTAKTAFELGEVESLIGLSQTDDFKGQSSVGLKKLINFNKLVAIFYNTKDGVLSDKNMRRALSAASPKIEGEEIAKTPIQPNSWAYNGEVREFLGDTKSAKNYLEKVASGNEHVITLTTTPSLSQVGEKVIQLWKQTGISAVLRVESGIPQNFQALLTSEPIPSDPDQYALWHSTQGKTNISKYSSPRVDKDLEDGRKTGDLEKRKEKYLDFQKVLLDDSPATFLYFPKTQIIYRKGIEDNLSRILDLQFPQI